MPESSAVEVIPSKDGRLPEALSVDGKRHPVAVIVRQWQTRGDDCFEVKLANHSSAIVYRDRWSGGWTVVEMRGRSRLA